MVEIGLDLKDKKILSVIEVDGRLGYSEIAKRVGLSKQVVKYRMDWLEDQDVIQEYYAIVNDSKLGREVYVVYLQLIDLSDEGEKKLISLLKSDSRILSYFSSVGNWDFTLAAMAKNSEELNELLQEVLKPINSKIRKKIVTSQLEFSYLSTKIFSDLGTKTSQTKLESKEEVDNVDLSLIKELLSKGDETLVELADKFDMSANGIKERIRNLEKKKIIVGYKTKINYEKLGFLHSHFFVWAKNMNPDFYKRVKSFLIQDGRVESVSRFFGYSDLEFRCNVASVGELYELKRKLKNHFKDEINSIELMIVVRSGISHLKKSKV
jgi:Lrp/AsnC family transcriptional regulator, leucine-responsive regulatory protein